MENLNEQLTQAQRLRETNKLEEAKVIYKSILEQHPNQLQAIMGLGHISRQQSQPEQALAYFQQAITSNPNELWPQLFLSEQLRDKSEFTASLEILNTIEKQYPNNFEIILRRGYIARAQGNHEQALLYFQQALQINPNHIWIKLAVIDELRWHGKFDQARELLNDALIKEPTNTHFLLRNFFILRELGQHKQAVIELHQAINIAPHEFQLHLELAIELRDQDQLEQSLTEFNFLQQNYPRNFYVLFHLANLNRRQGNHTQALMNFNKAIEIDSNNIHGHIAIVEVLRETQQFTAAWEKLITIEARFPPAFSIAFQKALLHRLQNKSDLALTCFQQAIALDPNNIWGQLQLAEELRHQGQFTQSLAILEPLETKPAYRFHVLVQKGHLYRAQNQHEQALSYFQQAYTLDNSNPHVLLEISNEQFKLGNINTAIETLIHNLKHRPTDLWTLLQIGNWLNIANAKEQALKFFQQALTAHPQHIQPYLNTAQLLYDLGRREQAFNLLQQAIEQCGERAEIYLTKAQMLWNSRELELALQCVSQGLNLFTDNYALQIRRIDFLIQLGHFATAQQFMNTCPIDTLDKKIQLQVFAAQIAEKQWLLDKAIAIYQTILKQRENYLPAHDVLRRLYLQKLDLVQAKHHSLMTTHYRLSEQKINGQSGRGHLHDHVAQMVDELLINQPILEQVKQATTLPISQRLNALVTLIQKEPISNAAANTLLLELRQQQYFIHGIPKRIFQYWDKVPPPPEIVTFTQSWIKHNTDYLYELFNEQTAREFLREHYEPKFLKAYMRITHAAQKADMLRLALLYEYGGVYADADDMCLKPLTQWLPADIKILFYQEEYATVGNNFIACIAKHPIIKQALDYAIESLLHRDKGSIWFATGPAMVTRALAVYLANNWSQATPQELGIMVITREELMQRVGIHGQLPYKNTGDSWLIKEFKSGKKLDVMSLMETAK